jgi:anti-sigma B factor antagonist
MSLEFHKRGEVDVIRLPERVMLATAAAVRADLLKHVDTGANRLVLDLGQLEFADSSGLSALLACVTAARRAGGDAVMAAPCARVRALIELTRLDEAIAVVSSVPNAIDHFTSRAG